jgi:hypothetical protein
MLTPTCFTPPPTFLIINPYCRFGANLNSLPVLIAPPNDCGPVPPLINHTLISVAELDETVALAVINVMG